MVGDRMRGDGGVMPRNTSGFRNRGRLAGSVRHLGHTVDAFRPRLTKPVFFAGSVAFNQPTADHADLTEYPGLDRL